jgi:hypothetical protein
VAKDIAVQMSDAFDEQQGIGANDYYFSVVNAGYLASSNLPHMPPFVSLAKTLGSMQAQINAGLAIKSITVKTMGAREVDVTSPKARQLLEACVLKGFLKQYLKGKGEMSPDLISSPSIAKDLGIEFSCSTEYDSSNDTEGFSNLVGVETKFEDGSSCSITGSVFGSVPHIVKMDHMPTNFSPEGFHSILTFRYFPSPFFCLSFFHRRLSFSVVLDRLIPSSFTKLIGVLLYIRPFGDLTLQKRGQARRNGGGAVHPEPRERERGLPQHGARRAVEQGAMLHFHG